MSNVGAVNHSSYYNTAAADTSARTSEKESTKEAEKNTKQNEGVVYERTSSTKNTNYVKKNASLIKQLQADSDARISQMRGIVEQMMSKQGAAIGKADSMWQF